MIKSFSEEEVEEAWQMSLMCFFLFLTKRISPFFQKTRDVEVKLVKCWECKGEGLASFGNSNSYCVYSYGNWMYFFVQKGRDVLFLFTNSDCCVGELWISTTGRSYLLSWLWALSGECAGLNADILFLRESFWRQLFWGVCRSQPENILKILFLRRKTKNTCTQRFSVTAFQFKKAINDVSVEARVIEQNKFLHQVLIWDYSSLPSVSRGGR